MTYLKYKEKIELGEKQFREIDKHCKKNNIDWFCSPWDRNSLKFMKKGLVLYLLVRNLNNILYD